MTCGDMVSFGGAAAALGPDLPLFGAPTDAAVAAAARMAEEG